MASQDGADRKLLGLLMEDREQYLLRGIAAAGGPILLPSSLALVSFSAHVTALTGHVADVGLIEELRKELAVESGRRESEDDELAATFSTLHIMAPKDRPALAEPLDRYLAPGAVECVRPHSGLGYSTRTSSINSTRRSETGPFSRKKRLEKPKAGQPDSAHYE